MQTQRNRQARRAVWTLMIWFLLLARRSAAAEIPSYPILAVDPDTQVAELENHTEVLRRWVSLGITKAVLLNIDTADGMRSLGTKEASLAEIVRPAAMAPVTAGGAEDGVRRIWLEDGFVRAAFALGIVREVYWIVPADRFAGPDPASALRTEMKAAGIADNDLRTFALREGCVRGTVAEAPFTVCGTADLPRIAEPVLLSVAADFIPASAAVTGANPIGEMKKLALALAERKYRGLDAVLVASLEAGRPTLVVPDTRWVGEVFAQSLRDPAVLTRPGMPKRWAALQTLARLQEAGAYSDALHEALPYLTVYEDDPALHLYAAEGLAAQGNIEDALAHARQACRLHRGYCSGLPWIGLALYAAGNGDAGERFFAAGTELRPQMVYGQLSRGLWLQNMGHRAEALGVFQVLTERGEAYPAAFLAGALHLGNGDRAAARRMFDRAVEALPEVPDGGVTDLDVAESIGAAVRFYREEGLNRQGALLESDVRLRSILKETPAAP